MPVQFKLQQFEGPLDLLLELIEDKKLEITSVSLASVTEQFLQHLTGATHLHPDELADFLVVAAKLLLIKSRALLPTVAVDEEEDDLEQQLKMYKLFYDASKVLEGMTLQHRYSFARFTTLRIKPTERSFRPPERVSADILQHHFLAVLRRLEPFLKLTEDVIIRTVNIKERIDAIRERIAKNPSMNFQDLLRGATSRTDVIVTFLALLELVKQRSVAVVQESTFSPITIEQR